MWPELLLSEFSVINAASGSTRAPVHPRCQLISEQVQASCTLLATMRIASLASQPPRVNELSADLLEIHLNQLTQKGAYCFHCSCIQADAMATITTHQMQNL